MDSLNMLKKCFGVLIKMDLYLKCLVTFSFFIHYPQVKVTWKQKRGKSVYFAFLKGTLECEFFCCVIKLYALEKLHI